MGGGTLEQNIKPVTSATFNVVHAGTHTNNPLFTHYLLMNKLGYNRHFPRVVSWGPNLFGGLTMKNFYTEAGIAKILKLIQRLSSERDIKQS